MAIVVAFLQCQYTSGCPKYWERRDRELTHGQRARMTKRSLFYSCMSGKVLRKELTQELCDRIVWANATTRLGRKPSDSFPPDIEHIQRTIRFFVPTMVVAFGRVAQQGVIQAVQEMEDSWELELVRTPHPASRAAGTREALREARVIIASHFTGVAQCSQ